MAETKEMWLVVADSESARLLHGTATRHDHVHLEEVGKLATTFLKTEHHRPPRMSQPGRSQSVGHEPELKVAHFAREVGPWLERELAKRAVGRCSVFAPARFIGALRQSVGKNLAGLLAEQEAELAQLSLADLSKHPRITALFPR